jgi:hypothetical protein
VTRRILLVAVMLAIAACGSSQSPSISPRDDCALIAEPGPADELDRDGGDLIDDTDYGGGRWRLCLAEPVVGAAENTAWCQWTPDRTAVVGISGQFVTIGSVPYDSGLVIASKEFFLTGYEPGPVSPSLEAADGGRSGRLGFGMLVTVDPEHGAAPGVAPRVIGVMRWQCGDPPPPR